MSTRRRPGSWQDGVAKSFSRLFSRSSSQDKDEDTGSEEQEKTDRSLSRLFFRVPAQERTDRGPQEEQERSPSRSFLRRATQGADRGPQEEQEKSPSRFFLRRATQDSKGDGVDHGGDKEPQEEQEGARGPQEEQEGARGFSRLFSKTSSQESQEEDPNKSGSGEEDRDRPEEEYRNLVPDIYERLPSSQTEQVNAHQSSNPRHQVTSESEEEKDTDYRQNPKVLDSEKQSRENFFHFIGNLFHFSPKTSLGNAKYVDSTQDLCKEHEDAQDENNLDQEDSHQEDDVSTSETEQTAEFSPAQAELSVESNGETPKEQQETPTSRPKLNGYPLEAPAVTYGTYRGSRRIRKLLKRRADVNSPIPEKEETSEKETSSTGDVGTENCYMLHDITNLEPISYRSAEEEIPPSKIQIKMKMQPKVQITTQNGEADSQEVMVLKQNAVDSSIVSVPSQNGEFNSHEDKDLQQNVEVRSLVFAPNQNGDSNSLEVKDLKQKPEVISFVSVPNQTESFPHETESFPQVENLKENVGVNSVVSRRQEPNSTDSSTIIEDIEQSTEECSEISNNVQLLAEKRSALSVHLSLDNANSSNISKEFQPNIVRNSNISEDLHPKAHSTPSCSMELVLTELFKISNDLQPNPERSSNISENLLVNVEKNLDSPKDPQSQFHNESNFSLDLSPHNDESSNISVDFQTNSEKRSNMLEAMQPGESLPVSADVQRLGEESPNIIESLQSNSEEPSTILQPDKNESVNSLYELKQGFEKGSGIDEENVMDLQSIPTENAKSVKTSENQSLLLQEIVTNGSLIVKDNLQPNGQLISMIMEKTVNTQSSLQFSEEPEPKSKEIPIIIEQRQSNVENIDDTLNEFNLASSEDDDTSGTILVNDNAQGSNISDVKSVPENFLNNGSSHVTETARTVSFDNGIECRSPSPTISGSLSSTDSTDIRCDSPLPLSDAIDSGMVSSQAYTPEEHMPIKIFPAEIFNKSISDPFIINEEDKRTGHVESEIENADNALPVAPLLYADNAVQKQDEPIIIQTESQTGGNSSPRVEHVPFLDSGVADVDGDVSGRTNGRMKVNLNPDVYVAKVSMKSVNIEEVKLPPYELQSDIISVSKVESATFEKELIRLPNLSPPPSEPGYDSEFKDFQQDEENVTNTEMPCDRNEEDPSVKVNNSFQEPSLFSDFNNHEKSPHSCYMEAERIPSLSKLDVVENVVNIFSNDVGDNIPQYTFLEKGLPTKTDKSPDVLLENFKNNNLKINASDDIINISLLTNTSENELANELFMSDDSQWELQSCDSLSEFHPNDDVTYKEPVKEIDVILKSTFQKDVNFTDGIHSSDTATSKMSLPSAEHSALSSESFEKKASEIIFSVLHSAIDEFQNLNKNHINAPSLGTVKEMLVESHLFQILEDHSAEHEAEAPEKSTDSVTSIVASRLVNDVLYSSKQIIQNSLDKNIGTNNSYTQASMVSVNDPDANKRHQNICLLDIDSSVLLNSNEDNSNILIPTPTSDSVKSEESDDLKRTGDTEEILIDSRHLDTSHLDKEGSQNEITRQVDSYSYSEAKIQGDTGNENVMFDLGLDGNQEGFFSKSLETEGSMNTPLLSHLFGENMCISGTECIDPFQFSLYDSKFIEIGSDDESAEEESGGNEQSSVNDLFLTVPTRRVRIYPLSLSPIYEDDSSCEDAVSNSSSPRRKKGTSTGSGANDHTSILSLLQSVSNRLKEANIEDMCLDEKLTPLSEAAAISSLDNLDASGTQENIPASTKSDSDTQKMPLEETTSEELRFGLFITKAENRPNPASGRPSFLLNLNLQSTTPGAKPSLETSPTATSANESSPSATSESSSIPYSDLSPDASPSTALSPLQMVTDSGLSAPKPEIKCQPRMSSKSVYYQYFHSSQNFSHGTENKEIPPKEKADIPTEKESKDTEDPLMQKMDSSSLKFNPRPGKVILSDVIHHENKIELKGDTLDATSWEFPNGVNIRVIRGCWILYEKPHFEGQAHVLEEGEAVLLHLWDTPGARAKPDKIRIGSVKRVVKDYLPEVVISPLEDTLDSPVYIHTEVPSLANLVDRRPRSLTVNSGVWLTYTEPQYSGTVSVLEEGCDLPQIQACGVKSVRPLKMGGLKVQLPNDPKIIIYEKPHFQGWSREISEHVSSIANLISDGDNTDPLGVGDNTGPLDVGSIQVVGGMWVGYEKERYKGYQYLLEEGEYGDWQAWGGYSSTLQSIRYLQANFLEASVTLLESDSEDGKKVDFFNQAIPDLELAGYNTKPQCMHVKKGMWVAYQKKHYCGEQYILEKGRYKSHMDWGGSSNTVLSIRPVLLEPLGRNEVKHLIKAYERADFQGESVDFTQVSDFISFMPKSFKVLRGCWLLCYQADACDNVCVLEEGHFPDLASCGCPTAEIKYIRPIDYVFAEPSISVFALDSCEGRELHFEEAITSILSEELHFYTQSVWVRRGLWIAFESASFLGRQMLLDPQQILNWSKFSGWKVIGSLRPLKQPAVYFMVRNRHRDKYLTVTGKLSDSRATFVSVSSRNGQSSQIWYFSRGFLKSKANDSCLDIIGGKNIPGSKVSLWAEHGKTRQKWKINKDGTISSYISDDLVLDVKGGNYYDQNYLIVNRAQESALTQKWDIEIL